MSIILFILVLALLILVHELGHFLVARLTGVWVEEFGLGFPPKIWAKRWGKTLYSLNLIPFGGFVKLKGEDIFELGSDKEGSLFYASRPRQALIMIAGVTANLILAWAFLSVALVLGLPSAASSLPAGVEITDPALTITSLQPNSPAALAGFKPGDRIIKLQSGEQVLTEPKVGQAFALIKNSYGQTIEATVKHPGAEQEEKIKVRPEIGLIEPGVPALGIGLEEVGLAKLPLPLALTKSFSLSIQLVKSTALGFWNLIIQSFSGETNLVKSLVGPIGLAGLVGDAGSIGLGYLLAFIAFISINLAVLNLIPFPALDGGRLLILMIESLIQRRLPIKIVAYANFIGFIILIGLMLIVTYGDLVRLF